MYSTILLVFVLKKHKVQPYVYARLDILNKHLMIDHSPIILWALS